MQRVTVIRLLLRSWRAGLYNFLGWRSDSVCRFTQFLQAVFWCDDKRQNIERNFRLESVRYVHT